MRLDDIETPALILDRTILSRNIAAMAARVSVAGLRLRPHMKTAKSIDVAKLATGGQFGGITVSTLAEARYFAAQGIGDITYGVGITPAKLAPAAAVQRLGARLTLITDDLRAAEEVSRKANDLDEEFDFLIEIDCGAHRGGLAPEADELLALGQLIDAAPKLHLAGVLTHAGQSYHCDSIAEVKAVADVERRAVVTAAKRLGQAGLPCPTVSAGSTPTAVHGEDFAGLTEVRPGVYMFFDLDQYRLGSCGVPDIAISVLASVIGHQPAFNRINIDAGSLALSQDRSASELLADTGFGWVMDPSCQARIGDLHVAAVNQEHGMIAGLEPLPFDTLPVGARVRILPNHACITAAAYGRYYVVDDGDDEVVEQWDRVNGW